MASIYGLVTKTIKKNYSSFYEKSPQNNFKKQIYSDFCEKTAAKTILQRF
jgi:hypothetical protein